MTIPNDQALQSVTWKFHDFRSLDTAMLFALMKLRVDVFVVEQACAYPELDEADTAPETLHLLGYVGDQLVAYARAMPGSAHPPGHDPVTVESGCSAARPIRIGRVVVARPYRGKGLATILMQQLMSRLQMQFPNRNHCLAAQVSVQTFYAALGFIPVSDVYLEDGIAHVDMVCQTI